MLDPSKLQSFQWDDGNEKKNFIKHGITCAEAEQALSHRQVLVVPDVRHSQMETRYRALGEANTGKLLQIIFTVRSQHIRVISARPMNKKEREIYEQVAKK